MNLGAVYSPPIPACTNNNNFIYHFLYFLFILIFLVIWNRPKNNFFKGFMFVTLVVVLIPIIGLFIKSTIFWHISHIIFFFILTYISPNNWAFWFAAGIFWEWLECYSPIWKMIDKYTKVCSSNLSICSGIFDITANIAGISLALLFHTL